MEIHPNNVSEAPHLRSSNTSPENCVQRTLCCIAADNLMARVYQRFCIFLQDWYSGVKEQRVSETKRAEVCYL